MPEDLFDSLIFYLVLASSLNCIHLSIIHLCVGTPSKAVKLMHNKSQWFSKDNKHMAEPRMPEADAAYNMHKMATIGRKRGMFWIIC